MSKNGRLKITALSGLLVALWLPSLGYPQTRNQNPTVRYQERVPAEDAAARQRQWQAGLQARNAIHNKENLVRRAYLLLMRYHRASNAQKAAGDLSRLKLEDDVQFEIRNVQTGPIKDILDKAMTDVITVPKRPTLVVWPEYYGHDDDPKHLVYQVRWSEEGRSTEADHNSAAGDVRLETTIREFLTSDPLFSMVEQYTSYDVTLRLAGRERNYRAIALHYIGPTASDGTTMVFADWVTGSSVLSKTLSESLPPVRAPWSTYVKSATYRAVVRAIKEAREQNRALIPTEGPLDYLPGDDAVPDDRNKDNRDKKVSAAAAACQSFDYTVAFDRNNLYPSGTGTPTTATVIVQTTPPQPNVALSLFLGEIPNAGGHYQHTGTRPLGALSSNVGVTGADGAFRSIYTTSIFGGPVAIGATVPSLNSSKAEIMWIAVPNLSELTVEPTLPLYTLTGSLSWHPGNHYGTAAARSGLFGIAFDYWQQFPCGNGGNGGGCGLPLQYNDMSLTNGGKFDINRDRTIPPDWTNPDHHEHLLGTNCDVYSGNVPTSQWQALIQIFVNNGSPNYNDETACCSHWHLRFQ